MCICFLCLYIQKTFSATVVLTSDATKELKKIVTHCLDWHFWNYEWEIKHISDASRLIKLEIKITFLPPYSSN